MIIGIGMDLVEIDRARRMLESLGEHQAMTIRRADDELAHSVGSVGGPRDHVRASGRHLLVVLVQPVDHHQEVVR